MLKSMGLLFVKIATTGDNQTASQNEVKVERIIFQTRQHTRVFTCHVLLYLTIKYS